MLQEVLPNFGLSALLTVVFGLVAPFVISFLKNTTWPKEGKVAFALGVAIAFAAANEMITRGYLTEDIVEASTAVFTIATVVYKFFLEGTPTEQNLADRKVL